MRILIIRILYITVNIKGKKVMNESTIAIIKW